MKKINSILVAVLFSLFFTGCSFMNPEKDKGNSVGEVSDFEMSILNEINLARKNPKAYFDNYITPMKSSFSSSYYESCKNDMSGTSDLGSYSFKEGLYKIAKDHVNTQGTTTATGHNRTDGRTWNTVIAAAGTYSNAGENISYGVNTARGIVIQLLVDDGISTLGHRKNMLSTTFDSAGVAFGEHKGYRCMCVIDFARNWKDK